MPPLAATKTQTSSRWAVKLRLLGRKLGGGNVQEEVSPRGEKCLGAEMSGANVRYEKVLGELFRWGRNIRI